MNAEEMLRSYKRKKGKVEVIQLRIDGYEEALRQPDGWEEVVLTPTRELGMPGNPNCSRSSSVEQAITNKEAAIEIIKEWIKEDRSRMAPLKMEINQIESAINSLNMQEKKIIEWKYFESMFWKDIELKYNDTFRDENRITTEGLKKIKKKALEQVEDILLEGRARGSLKFHVKYSESIQ